MKYLRELFVSTKQFLVTDVPSEMKKVSWPTKNTVYASTKAVIFSVAILSVYVSFFDALFKYLLEVSAR